MKSVYKKKWISLLPEAVEKNIYGFHRLKLRLDKQQKLESEGEPGEIIFERKVDTSLSVFLVFVPNRRHERFTLYIGWSSLGRFPHEITRPNCRVDEHGSEFDLDEGFVSFLNLYTRSTGKGFEDWPVWKCSVDFRHPDFIRIFMAEDSAPVTEAQAESLVATAIEKCIEDVCRYGEAYIKELVEHRNRQDISPADPT